MSKQIISFAYHQGDVKETLAVSKDEGNRNMMIFDCPEPQTPFAPPKQQWCVFESVGWDLDMDVLRDFFLSKEQYIRDIAIPEPDVAPQAPSLTQRLRKYNIFMWEDECSELTKLRKCIKRFHKEYVRTVFEDPNRKWDGKKMMIRSWFNILRKGEQIGNHIHSTHPHSYLAGNMVITCDESQTIYCHPLYQLEDGYKYYSNNKPGTISLFPGTVPHFTSVHQTDTPRITLGWDLTTLNDPGSILYPL